MGESDTLVINVLPQDATDKSVTIVSGNTSILTVDQTGRFTCHAVGLARITVTSVNGKSDYVIIKVVEVIDLEEYAAEVLRLTNIERQNNGLSALSDNNSLLNAAAMVRATEIIESFSHTRPDGRACGTAYTDLGGKYSGYYTGLGENIYMWPKTPQEAVDGWMDSTGHRNNILNSRYTHMGVGVAMDKDGYLYWVQLFYG